MGDMGEMWDGHKARKQEQHQEWYVKNMNALNESNIPFVKKDTVCLFRQPYTRAVDFYPHTGRWRIVGKGNSGTIFTGGGAAFVAWYKDLKPKKKRK